MSGRFRPESRCGGAFPVAVSGGKSLRDFVVLARPGGKEQGAKGGSRGCRRREWENREAEGAMETRVVVAVDCGRSRLFPLSSVRQSLVALPLSLCLSFPLRSSHVFRARSISRCALHHVSARLRALPKRREPRAERDREEKRDKTLGPAFFRSLLCLSAPISLCLSLSLSRARSLSFSRPFRCSPTAREQRFRYLAHAQPFFPTKKHAEKAKKDNVMALRRLVAAFAAALAASLLLLLLLSPTAEAGDWKGRPHRVYSEADYHLKHVPVPTLSKDRMPREFSWANARGRHLLVREELFSPTISVLDPLPLPLAHASASSPFLPLSLPPHAFDRSPRGTSTSPSTAAPASPTPRCR